MTAGVLMQLAAAGEQDKYIIGNPEMTHFKKSYKRHTNFSIGQIPQYFMESADFGKKATCLIDKKGDLLNDMILELELPALQTNVSWINSVGHHIIEYVELVLSGISICKMTGQFLDIYSQLTVPYGKRAAYYKMTAYNSVSSYNKNTQEGLLRLFIPLPFWFCKDFGSSLPLIAMQHTDVRVVVKFRPFNECWYSGTSMSTTPSNKNITTALIMCDYIYLDTFERKKFASTMNLEYLIEQVQTQDANAVRAGEIYDNYSLYLNHPVKTIYWIYQADGVSSTNDWGNYSRTLDDDTVIQTKQSPIDFITFRLNGHNRIDRKHSNYFRYVEQYKRHTNSSVGYVYSYNFSLNPDSTQPYGSCNFSRIESCVFSMEFPSTILAGQLKFFATNYNILRIKNGMSGLAFTS